ncbi:MAG: class I SAM-dependent methyltransferase [Actinobacteria bacterium]|nr:class I SAM-dependent methyltransferase [Actinomycetota bacterium]
MPDTPLRGCDNGRVQPSPPLLEVLERARRLGVLGPGPVLDHVSHAEGFIAALEDLAEGSLLIDLGSGGGVPGLVIAEARPDLRVVLLDSLERRVALLAEAIVALKWEGRVVAELARAEDTGRSPQWRGQADAVTARSFGPPATVAECAAPLLRIDGVLVVSEPPEETDRWPADGLAPLGLVDEGSPIPGMRRLRQTSLCPETYPRRVGMPAKRPDIDP